MRGADQRLLLETKKGLAHTQEKGRKKICQKKNGIHESKEKDSSTWSFQQRHYTISYEVIKATSINEERVK